MSKACFKKGCIRRSAFTCDCKAGTYFCKKHMGDHMLIQRPHNIESLYVILDEPEEKKMKIQSEKVMKAYSELYQSAQEHCKNLIESVVSNTKKLLDEIEKIRSAASRLYICIFKSVPIDSEDLRIIESLNFQENSPFDFGSSKFVKTIDEYFDYTIESISSGCGYDDYAFYNDMNSQNIYLVDTQTLKLSTKAFKWQTIAKIGAAFKVKKDSYLAVSTSNGVFNTGNSPSQFLIQEINFALLTVENYHSPGNLSGGGIVSINNTLYCFTGIQNSYKFEIEKKVWSKIAPIPQNCSYTSAAYVQKKTYVTGYCLNYIYQFDLGKNTYTSTIDFPSNNYRYLFDAWVVSLNDSLYEIKDGKLVKHQALNQVTSHPLTYSGFKRGRFIYFIAKAGYIFRIDTMKKIINECQLIN